MIGLGIGVGGVPGAGSVSSSGAGTNNTIAKFTGGSTIANSSITDNGTTVSTTEAFTQGSAGQTAFNASGLLTSYNALALAGQGVSPIVAFAATTPTTPVGSTTILATAPAGLYRATIYYVLTTAGIGGTAITVNVTYTDAQQAQTNSSITSSGLVQGQFASGTILIQQQSAVNITYTITETGTFSTHPVLALKVALERIQ